MIRELAPKHAAWAEVAYITGWRVKSEILTRTWDHVDLEAGWLRLEPGETKNRRGRQFPLIARLREVIERQDGRKRQLEKQLGIVIPFVFFHEDGQRIRRFEKSWATARDKAGLPDFIPHDYRRTAVRNLERSGILRSTAMAMVGHETESIYGRYAIQDEASLREGGERLSALYGTTTRPDNEDAQLRAAVESQLRDVEAERSERKGVPFRRSDP